jgi:hypothetical protein
MTIARRSLEEDVAPVSGDVAVAESRPGSAVRPSPAFERPELPAWALAAGIVLVLVFAGLVVQTYSGRSLLGRLAMLVPGPSSEQVTDTAGLRALYVPGSTVQIGQAGIGARGQDRAFQAGDTVLLGATGQLVRLEESGRLTELRPTEGASLVVASLGAWDPTAGGLAGLKARYAGGAWSIEAPPLQSVAASLHAQGAPEEELTDDFQLVPTTGGRVRRFTTSAGPSVRIRPNGRMPSLQIEGRDPLPMLDGATVTVRATVRAAEGANVELALADVLDAGGALQRTADRRIAADEEEWMTLRVQRRVTFGSPRDRYAVGLIEVRNRDWLEVRELGVYLGVLP